MVCVWQYGNAIDMGNTNLSLSWYGHQTKTWSVSWIFAIQKKNSFSLAGHLELKYFKNWCPNLLMFDQSSAKDDNLLRIFLNNKSFIPIDKSFFYFIIYSNLLTFLICLVILLILLYTHIHVHVFIYPHLYVLIRWHPHAYIYIYATPIRLHKQTCAHLYACALLHLNMNTSGQKSL